MLLYECVYVSPASDVLYMTSLVCDVSVMVAVYSVTPLSASPISLHSHVTTVEVRREGELGVRGKGGGKP